MARGVKRLDDTRKKGVRDRVVGLRRVRAGDLLPDPRNWRRHPKAQRDAMRGVLAEIGFADALLARETPEGLMLVDGHLRADLDPKMEVPVLVLDLDEAEAGKLLATLDPLAAMAQPDMDALLALLSSVSFESPGVNAMLEALANGETQPLPGLTDPDDAPELPEESWVKRGEIFQMGRHRLMCGDSTSAEDAGKLLGDAKPLLMVTDPPYGVNYEPEWRNEAAERGLIGYAAIRVALVTNDNRTDWSEAYRLFLGDVAYTWSPPGDHVIETGQAIQTAGFDIRSGLVWRKQASVISRGHYRYQHEPCWYAVRRGATAHWIGGHSQSSVWDIPWDKNVPGGHSTQKPLECMERPIRNHEAREVYDPFLGSGTTLIACERLGRICYGMEIEPRYVQVSLERWEAFTGRKAQKVS